MKKSVICILLTFLVCFFVASCTTNDSSLINNFSTSYEGVQNMNSKFTLTVNGKDISTNDVSINHEKKYAEIPMIATLKALDCDVEWVNNKRVKITYEDIVYILNPSKKTLKKRGDSSNILLVAPGATHDMYCEVLDEEFIIDSSSLLYFLYLLDAKIIIDYDNDVVKINWKTSESK